MLLLDGDTSTNDRRLTAKGNIQNKNDENKRFELALNNVLLNLAKELKMVKEHQTYYKKC